MISFAQAQDLLSAHVQSLEAEDVAMADAAGRVLAADLQAQLPSPRTAVSAMDGYAVLNEDVPDVGTSLCVVGESYPGQPFLGAMQRGDAVRIFTGAPIPGGADRVIMQENVERLEGGIQIVHPFGPGWHVRQSASDFAAGDVLLPRGTRLSPRAMVAAAAADRATLRVTCRPRVTVIGTGDELFAPGQAAATAHGIPESVSFGVAALAQEQGALVLRRIRARDELESLKRIAGDALSVSDVVVVTGGASVGEKDFAKPMFEPHGLELLFGKVAIKPGKPVWLGKAQGKWILGLPGNPTSAMVTARLFLVPLLNALQGAPALLRWQERLLADALPATGDRETFVRAIPSGSGLRILGNQDSGAQQALAMADWLIRCPAGQAALPPGSPVEAIAF